MRLFTAKKLIYTFSSSGIIAGAALCYSEDIRRNETLQYPKWDYNWDRRDPEGIFQSSHKGDLLRKGGPTATRHIFLIRHGQYIMSPERDLEKKLTTIGQEQANILGSRLKALNHPYNKIIVSTMTRAKETADIVSKYLPDVPIESCQFIHEGAPIAPEPPTSKWKPPSRQFYEDGARIEAAFRKHFYRANPSQKKDSYEIIVCHANVIRYFICRALQFPPEAWLRFSLNHCSITWLAIRPSGRVICMAIGDSGYLAPHLLTTNT